MARHARIGAVLLALAVEIACRTPREDVVGYADDPRARCRKSFAECAPPANFAASTDVSTLDVRKLVHVASRMDVPDALSASAAARLRKLAVDGDAAVLLEMEAALEDSEALLGKCRCPDPRFRPEIDKQGIREAVAGRLPTREQRSPDHWAELVVRRLAAARDLARRSAELLVTGATDGSDDADGRARQADLELCETVHAARGALSQEQFARMIDLAYEKRSRQSGAGSAELARNTVREHAGTSSCEAKPKPPPE